jgi:hypothetical protein
VSPIGGGPRWFPGDVGHHHVLPGNPHYVAAWHRGCCEPVTHADRASVLREAANKLDAQADAHGHGIHDYTDLLRVWADDVSRWEAGR